MNSPATTTNDAKGVDYSYPSSTNAQRFGFAKQGCWTVSLHSPDHTPIALAAFPTEAMAYDFANQHPAPWHPLWGKKPLAVA